MTITLSPWPVVIPLSGLALYVVGREVVTWGVRKHLPLAHIATNLAELARVRASTYIRCVGYDLECLVSDYTAWRKLIRKWTDTGARVTYLVHDCSEEQLVELRKKRSEFDPNGFLDIRRINPDVAPPHLVEQSRERHWTLFSGPAQLWTEAEHRIGDSEAKGCDFVRPGWLDSRYFRLSRIFNQMARDATTVN